MVDYYGILRINAIIYDYDPLNLKLSKDNKILFKKSSIEKLHYLNKKRTLKNNDPINIIHIKELTNKPFIYGIPCSLRGYQPVKCKEMLSLVNNKNYDKLKLWLNSLNPEIVAYGYTGLSFLKLNGVRLDNIELKKMKQTILKNIQLFSCQGCVHYQSKTMSELLITKNIRSNFKSLKENNFIK